MPRRKGRITAPNRRKGWRLRARGRAKETTERSGLHSGRGQAKPGAGCSSPAPPEAKREAPEHRKAEDKE
jgi:hypothetical protein